MTIIGTPQFSQDGCYTASAFRNEFGAVVCAEGVQDRSGGDLLVTQSGATSVSVAAGDAWIAGSSSGSGGMYYVSSPTAQPFSITNTGVTHQEAIVAVVKDDQYDTGPTQWEIDILEPYSAASAYPLGPLDGPSHSGLIVLSVITVDASGVISSMSDTRDQAQFCESMVPDTGTAPVLLLPANGSNFTKASYPGLRAVRARVVGGGGAGGGAVATGGGVVSGGTGGNSGDYAESMVDASSLAASVPITVGAGGAGVAGGNGGSGAQSSFGSIVVAGGGRGGAAFGSPVTAPIVTGGTDVNSGSLTGQVTVRGGRGGPFISVSSTYSSAGFGGSGPLGDGGAAPSDGNTANGGTQYGGGGSGTANHGGQSDRSGGSGAAGVVLLELFF